MSQYRQLLFILSATGLLSVAPFLPDATIVAVNNPSSAPYRAIRSALIGHCSGAVSADMASGAFTLTSLLGGLPLLQCGIYTPKKIPVEPVQKVF